MNIAFRVDSSIEIGTGHTMRCLTLADKFNIQENNILFIISDFLGNQKDFITKKGYFVVTLSKFENLNNNHFPDHLSLFDVDWEKDAKDTINNVKNYKLDLLIVDHYGIDYRWHSCLRKYTKQLMVIDDLANRQLDCDLLLDQTYGRKKKSYIDLIPNHTKMLLGTNFALVRPEFALLRSIAHQKRNQNTEIRNILISIGGMDSKNITGEAIIALEATLWKKRPEINIVLNKTAPHLNLIMKKAKNSNFKIKVIIDASNMAELMLNADLAIGASGTTSWERCVLGLPTITICLAENQRNIYNNLEKVGAHLVLKNENKATSSLIENKLNEILENPKSLDSVSSSAFKICDGNGIHWVNLKISPIISNDSKEISLRDATMADSKIIFDWQCLPQTREFSNNPKLFSWEQHLSWMKSKLNETLSFFWIIKHSEESSGVVRLDPINFVKEDGYLISIFLKPDKYSLGVASGALEICKMIFPNSTFYAKIFPENISSISLFKKSGFKFRKDLNHYEWRLLLTENE